MLYCRQCKDEMECVDTSENTQEGRAYRIFHCYWCQIICRHDYWNNAGYLWIMPDNKIINEREEVK